MAFPILAAIQIGSALLNKGQGQGQGGPSFQLPQFGGTTKQPNYLTQLLMSSPPPAAASGGAPNPDQVSTKDFITRAFLGNLINSAFSGNQRQTQQFTPPVFR